MRVSEIEFQLPVPPGNGSLLDWLALRTGELLADDEALVRLVITESDRTGYKCEATTIQESYYDHRLPRGLTMAFRKRRSDNTSHFNVAMLIPTGIGAEIGGHAGDATPVAQLLASVCDTLVLHPNVVNASDVNEMPPNSLYVEGSVLCRLMMGTIGLQPVRANRVLALLHPHSDRIFSDLAVNAVNAARSSYGLICPKIVEMERPLVMSPNYTKSARAAGQVEGFENLFELLDEYRGEYDAVAISSVISTPLHYYGDYFFSDGSMVNPWGGVESMLTHTISSLYNLPSAHAPMLESQEILDIETGIVDPRMAAEVISVSFLQCVLKGLQKSPKIVTDEEAMREPGVLTARDVSCLVIPDGCLGLPTLAALEQGIPVIAVRENANLMKNDLTALPWANGQLHIVDNYWEAAGVLAAFKAGIDPAGVRRPFPGLGLNKTDRELAESNVKAEIPEFLAT
ncbi:MAG: high light inducible protein [SAR202 cluster bacterium Io17-Chloro-G7]|nr:MAG: high light inducible protein [SAR202 cluster bacterium Io17-Chloro-G7]